MATEIARLFYGSLWARFLSGMKIVIATAKSPRPRVVGFHAHRPGRWVDGRFFRPLTASLALLLIACIASLWTTVAAAQSYTFYVEPVFLYSGGPYAPFFSPSLAAAFANAQSQVNALDTSSYTYSESNLHPDDAPWDGPPFTYFDAIPAEYRYDLTTCYTGGSCSLTPDWEIINTEYACPMGSAAAVDYNSPSTNQLIACPVTVSNVQPPPKNCRTCFGNPIYAATGQKVQAEPDYSGASGLSFIRTYRSNTGFFASVLNQSFVNNSSPPGTTYPACYPAYYNFSGYVGGFYCFPYISTFTYVNNGVAQYLLSTDDGLNIGFSGPNSAVTANADVNERVTMLTVNGATEWRVVRDDDSTELYNAAGSLLQKTLRGGQIFTYTYSNSNTPASIAPTPGLLLTQSDAFGHTLAWQYNSAGQMTRITDPAGGLYQYSYDSNGNLTGIVYPDLSSKTYWYNESANTGGTDLPNALTGITDETGVRYATFQYNSSGLAVNTQHAGGVESFTFSYPSPGVSASVVDPLGTTRTYLFQQGLSYDQDGSQTQPAASGSGTVTQSETYDANGNPASVTDYDGNVTSYLYDLTRNLETSRTEAYGTPQARTITTQWNATWRQPALITEPNRTTAFTYDALGNVLTKTITDTTVSPTVGRVWTYTYDTYGRMLTADGPRTDVVDKTTYAYYTCTTGYQCGEVHTITNALGQVTTFNTYNAHGQPLTITDANNVLITLTYDKRLRLLSREVGTETTYYSYYPTGLLKQVTLPDSSDVLFTYDAAHRLTKISDGLGNYISYTLDNKGNRTAEKSYDASNVLHRTHARVINALNQDYQEINAAGTAAVTTTFGFDDNGNQLSAAAPLSRNSANQYDPLSRLTQITDPTSGITQLGYDANDNLASVKDPRNLTTSYTHTGFGEVKQVVSPDTGTSTKTFDSGGNLKTATDARGAVATYSYDALNRMTQQSYTDQVINFTYDAGTNGKGRLTGASDANHSMSWTYDTLGRVSGKGQTIGTVTKSVGYTYTNGDLTTLVTPSGQTVTYTYTNHRITSIKIGSTVLLSGASYDPFGPPTAWSWGNSSTVSRAFDQDGSPHQIVTAGVTNGYTVDAASRITSITDSGLSTATWNYTNYDALDRIKAASSTAKSRGYTYDADGNISTITGSTASAETFATGNNQLNSTTGGLVRSYTYDAAGNTKSYTGETFTYNQRGRMSTATSTSATSYLYNALGQLIEKSGNGGTTLLVYDEHGHILGEYSSAGALIQETIWMDDLPVATIQPSGSSTVIYYVHTDHLGSPRKITNPSGNTVVWRWDPDTYGSVTPSITTINYNLRFPGQYYLVESGLHYNYFRTYDPRMGRYIESDPIGLRGGINPYAYVRGNPVSLIDPFGLYPAIEVTRPNGTTYIPMTTVKNPAQAAAYGLPVGTATAIATPPGANPQGDVSCWANAKDKSFGAFKNYWSDPLHNYKVVDGPMYDAYGNFEFGATGAAADFSLFVLQAAADYLHGWNNNPINTNDINSGFNAIAVGGTLSIIDYNPPSQGGSHGFH